MRFFHIESDEKRFTSKHFKCLEFVTESKDWTWDVNAVEVLHELFKGHGEITIIDSDFWSNSLLNSLVNSLPEIIVCFTSETLVLCFSPRISESHDSIVFSNFWNIDTVKDSVSMSRLQSWEIDIWPSSCYNGHSFVCRIKKFIPNYSFIRFIMLFFNLIVVAWSNWKSLQNFMRTSSANGSIWSFDFGPSFFKEHNPDLSSGSFAEDRSVSICKNWDVIIDDYLGGNSCFHDHDFVDSDLVDLKIIVEDVVDSFLNFCQSGDWG